MKKIPNYARFINPISAKRLTSPIRRLTEIQSLAGPELLAFGSGAPNASLFPFEKITIQTKTGANPSSVFTLEKAALAKGLQYAPTPGFSDLLQWLKKLQTLLHNPPIPFADAPEAQNLSGNVPLDIIITPGSQDGLCKIFEMALNESDHVLLEEPNYPGTLAILRPLKIQFLGLKADENGTIPSSLRDALSMWSPEDAKNLDCRIPKLLYLQPNACNPTGKTISEQRRKEIYQIAQLYDLLIVEDDPYYFLTFDKPPASFLSIDVDGRVVRLDSMSKVMSAGIRLGFVTGPKPLIDRIALHLQVSSLQCSSLSQAIVLELANAWGANGFVNHAKKVAEFYRNQCEAMVEAAEANLKGLAEWVIPSGGMFLWFHVVGVKDTQAMMERALQANVLLAPGNAFAFETSKPSAYLRASFSGATKEQMHEKWRRGSAVDIFIPCAAAAAQVEVRRTGGGIALTFEGPFNF